MPKAYAQFKDQHTTVFNIVAHLLSTCVQILSAFMVLYKVTTFGQHRNFFVIAMSMLNIVTIPYTIDGFGHICEGNFIEVISDCAVGDKLMAWFHTRFKVRRFLELFK